MTVAVITPEQLHEICRKGTRVDLIDVRTPIEYRELHVEFARNVPLDQLDPAKVAQNRTAAACDPVYVICRSGSRGQKACEQFMKAGLTNVVNVEGGTLACERAGLPMTRGKKALAIERQVQITAGSLVILGAVLGWLVHPGLVGLSAFVGAGLLVTGLSGSCIMGMLFMRMPWNKCPTGNENCCNQ